jgi:hypothetical protein
MTLNTNKQKIAKDAHIIESQAKELERLKLKQKQLSVQQVTTKTKEQEEEQDHQQPVKKPEAQTAETKELEEEQGSNEGGGYSLGCADLQTRRWW